MTPKQASASLACERLARSRERLRQALLATAPGSPGAGPAGPDWLDGLKVLPGFDLVLVALRAWWSQQPLHQAGLKIAEAAKAALLPVAQRAPVSLALGAAAAGGLLVWLRPWRWLPVAALIGAMTPKLLGKIATGLPLQAWLAAWADYAGRTTPEPAPRHHSQADTDAG